MPTKPKFNTLRTGAAIAVLLLFVAPLESRRNAVGSSGEPDPFHDTVLRCVLALDNDMYGKGELSAGLNYELLRLFAGEHECGISVRIASANVNYADSLALGTLDILVARSDSIPAASDPGAGGVIKSRNTGRRSAWYLGADADAEMKDVNLWICSYTGTKEYRELRSRFTGEFDPRKRIDRGLLSGGLSPYDTLVKKYAATIGWDWRLLTALLYQESRFSINTLSRRGATGLMQIRPSTAATFGVTDLVDPEQNLLAGTKFLAQIQRNFDPEAFTPDERVNFTLAAYNAGERRISDCRTLAAEKGLDNTKWEAVAGVIPEMTEYTIASPDSTSYRTGRFRGGETVSYVSSVLSFYSLFRQIRPE